MVSELPSNLRQKGSLAGRLNKMVQTEHYGESALLTWSATLSDIHPVRRRDGTRANITLSGALAGWSQQLVQGGGSNKGSWEFQKVGEDASLARSAILLDLRWGELTNTRTP